MGGLKLPLALTEHELVDDECEFVVQPILAGHGGDCPAQAEELGPGAV